MRFIIHATAAVILLSLSTLSAAATRPAAPQVTLGADLKTLRFDWTPVAGATFYRLWIKPGGTRYIAASDRIPASITHAEHVIPVHLQDWDRTRYVVTACNSAGCTGSAALNPRNLMLQTIGYFKASNTDPGDHFGREVALSDDGLTLAVSAEFESSNATGVNGNQADNSTREAGAVYVYRRTGAQWRQEAYLKSGVTRIGTRFGIGVPKLNQRAIALSGNGSIAAIGAPAQNVGAFNFAGEVYVYRRGSTGWRLVTTLRAPELSVEDYFGTSVDISVDGRTIKVSALNPVDFDSGHTEGRTHIFERSGSTWVHKATLAPYYTGDVCPNVRMSGDGLTLVGQCVSLTGAGARAVTLKRIGDAWVHADDLTLTTFTNDQTLALNYSATALGLSQGSGNESPAGIYRWTSSGWVSDATLSPPQTGANPLAFGENMAFSRDGQRLVVANFLSQAAGAGVSRTLTTGSAFDGAVYLYERTGTTSAPWRLLSVVKASNPGDGDRFGLSVALSGSGRTLAVGARAEDSSARGIDGNQTSERAPDAGAAYLY